MTHGRPAQRLARAIRQDSPHRASGEMAQHVLDLMTSITEAAERLDSLAVQSRVTPPEVLPDG
ncbi:hypothetical protein [Streptomyces rugosispiralis]|uniref:Uncharacterized protein n=1 Tax=Streptomyces rugosispiralis TaxID=2967341 RepID=A0ABT1V5G7_9ACTN|nr:hypothetical protein [Streptomyces rugosispiralis]MCQ8192624.1 hypothetical protein [Streptomyces rugosispiralis]